MRHFLKLSGKGNMFRQLPMWSAYSNLEYGQQRNIRCRRFVITRGFERTLSTMRVHSREKSVVLGRLTYMCLRQSCLMLWGSFSYASSDSLRHSLSLDILSIKPLPASFRYLQIFRKRFYIAEFLRPHWHCARPFYETFIVSRSDGRQDILQRRPLLLLLLLKGAPQFSREH